jgi:hypothetical protein
VSIGPAGNEERVATRLVCIAITALHFHYNAPATAYAYAGASRNLIRSPLCSVPPDSLAQRLHLHLSNSVRGAPLSLTYSYCSTLSDVTHTTLLRLLREESNVTVTMLMHYSHDRTNI